jgi:hypothetical protein
MVYDEKLLMRKAHVLSFEVMAEDGTTRSLLLGTDDLESIAASPWFSAFMGIPGVQVRRGIVAPQRREVEQFIESTQQMPHQQMQQPIVQPPSPPQAIPQREQQRDIMSIAPNEMSDALWSSLTDAQQQQWHAKWSQEIEQMRRAVRQ